MVQRKINKIMPLTSKMNIAVFLYLLAYISISYAIYCPLTELSAPKLEINNHKNYYECPGIYATHYTECCGDNRCCTASHFASVYLIDQNLAFMIALSVSLLCLVFSILLLICCFCPSCPLYNSCKMRYTRDYAGCAHKMGEVPMYSSIMPMDSPVGNTVVIAHPLSEKPNGYIDEDKCKEAIV